MYRKIENLNPDQLAKALEDNGYGECGDAIRNNFIDGHAFLQLTEFQIASLQLPPIHSRRLWSFLIHVKENPKNFILKYENIQKAPPKPLPPIIATKPNFLSPNTPEGIKKSSLTKEESNSFKNQLEQAFQTSCAVTNPSFLYNRNNKLPLPPKPQFSDFNIGNEAAELLQDSLPQFSQNKNFGHVHNTRNAYENQTTKKHFQESSTVKRNITRPLPSIPALLPKTQNQDEDEIYTPVLADPNEEDDTEYAEPLLEFNKQAQMTKKPSVNRLLPPLPAKKNHTMTEVDEILEDYGTITENNLNDNNVNTSPQRSIKPLDYTGRLLPPLPLKKNHTMTDVDEVLEDYGTINENNLNNNVNTSPQHSAKPLDFIGRRPLPPIPLTNIAVKSESNDGLPKTIRKVSNERKISNNERLLVIPSNITLKATPPASPRSVTNVISSNITVKATPPVSLRSVTNVIPSNITVKATPPVSPRSVTNVSPHRLPKQDYDFKTEFCYRETDRKGAKILLQGLQSGAYLIRPSREKNHLCTFSIIHPIKMLNFGVEKNDQGYLQFKTSTMDLDQPKFKTIQEIVSYYTDHPLIYEEEGVLLQNILPIDKR